MLLSPAILRQKTKYTFDSRLSPFRTLKKSDKQIKVAHYNHFVAFGS